MKKQAVKSYNIEKLFKKTTTKKIYVFGQFTNSMNCIRIWHKIFFGISFDGLLEFVYGTSLSVQCIIQKKWTNLNIANCISGKIKHQAVKNYDI